MIKRFFLKKLKRDFLKGNHLAWVMGEGGAPAKGMEPVSQRKERLSWERIKTRRVNTVSPAPV